MNQILVAGGSGIIGSFLKQTFGTENFTFFNSQDCNLISNDSIKFFFTHSVQFDILIYLVGLAHRKGKNSDLKEFNNINYHTLVKLLSYLSKNNKVPDKIIFASTISVYGEEYNQSIYTEDSEKKPFSPYAVTKLQAEQYLLDNFGSKAWILRFAPVYSSDFLLNINRRTRIGSIPYRIGKGTCKLSLCNIQNIGVTVKEIINDQVPAGIYNLSDQKEYSYNELLKKQQAKWILPIPKFMIKMAYVFGKVTGNIFLKENAVKLLTDNVYPSSKIRSHVDFSATLNNIN